MAIRASSGGDRVSAFNYCSIYNTSSITEHNGHTYEVTFSTAAGNSNYCPVVNADVETNQWVSNIGSSSYRMRTGGSLGSSIISGIVFQN